MKYFIGLDIGTSSTKALLISENKIIASAVGDYPVYYPQPGWSQQNPSDWLRASLATLEEVTAGIDKSQVCAISFSGQMHGLVTLDKNDKTRDFME